MVSSTLIDQEDFARVAYESIEDGVKLGNLKYREMFFNPTLHTTRGVPMPTIVDGLVDGIQAAEKDLGVPLPPDRRRLPAGQPGRWRVQMVEEVLEHRRDELIGLGMDAAEAPDPPEQFVEAYALAGAGGLRLTSARLRGRAREEHRDLPRRARLRADRPRVPHPGRRLARRALPGRRHHFTVCPTSTAVVYGWPEDSRRTRSRDDGRAGPASAWSTPTIRRCSTPTSAPST